MDVLTSVKFLALLAMLATAVFTDIRERRIPNELTVVGAAVAIALSCVQVMGLPVSNLLGMIVGLALAIPFFALGALGAGDAKLLSAVGAFVGVGALLPVLLYSAIAGGVIAVAVAVRRGVILPVLLQTRGVLLYAVSMGRLGARQTIEDPNATTIPYGVAIAAGTVMAWFFPISLGVVS